MFTSLFMINIKSGEQKRITSPVEHKRDVAPQIINDYVIWVRHNGRKIKGDVLIRNGLKGKDQL